VWPAAGFMLILKLTAIGLLIILFFRLTYEFTGHELHIIRSMIRFPGRLLPPVLSRRGYKRN
jgi:hypothetical protein